MSEIRPLVADEFGAFVDILVNAYPSWITPTAEEKDRLRGRLLRMHEEDPQRTAYGLFREGKLLGGMFLYDFVMNFRGVRVNAGGVGQVAVDLVHRKEHVAKELITYFIRHYRARGAPITMLYPFRPDFYWQMGFGYGTKMSQYRLRPAALPRGPSKAHVRALGEADVPALLEFYNRTMARTHGLIERREQDIRMQMSNVQHRFVGYQRDAQIQGYLLFTFEKGESFFINDIHVREFFYEDPEALAELLTFLHDQADQVRHIIFDTPDESFHFLPLDPRNGSYDMLPSIYHESNTQGLGLMYRVVDVPALFRLLRGHNFGGQTCQLKLIVTDSFLPENAGSMLLHFVDGRLYVPDYGSHDVELQIGIAGFSSLLAGAVNLRSLYRYGLVDVSDPARVDTLDAIFAVPEKPVCVTAF